MKTTPFALPAFMLVLANASYPAAVAGSCGNSFYCYGDTATSVVSVAMRPPPIPPPSRHLMRQRNQAQLAMRTHTTYPRVTPPAPSRPIPRTPVIPPPARPVVSACPAPALMAQAGWLESQAVVASTRGDRMASVRLFRDAAQIRQRAARMGCR